MNRRVNNIIIEKYSTFLTAKCTEEWGGSRGFAVRGFALKNGAVFGILSNLLTVFGILSNLLTVFGFENPDGLGFRCIFSAVFGITPPISTVFGIQNKRGSRFSIILMPGFVFFLMLLQMFCFIPLVSPPYIRLLTFDKINPPPCVF